jgi:filamentous hemagglutinin family protein
MVKMNRIALRHIMATGLLALGMGHLHGNPTGGQVAAGSASINTVPGTVTINQASNIAIINWQTFSIGAGELTKFVQPSSTSAALNRVLGGQTSIISGTLSANGQVYLINGNGIVVGPGGVVNASTFVASTRDIADSDFLSGNLHFTGGNSSGVQNTGTINALGGDVYLIGKTVDNQGAINAANGTAGLASGDDVLLNLSGEEHVFVSPSPTATSASTQTAVHNSGTISAASAELKAANGNLFALAINNEGTVRATAVKQRGGRIFLTTDAGLVQNTGTIKAKSGKNGGTIKITGGSLWNRKTIDASGAQGGMVTVNAKNVQNDGVISVKGTLCIGGCVTVTYSGNALGSIKGLIDASGKTQGGSIQFLGTGANSEAYLSLKLNAGSTGGVGGSIDIDTPTLYLTGATLTANGATQGGRIFLGEGDPLSAPSLPLAQTVFISIGTSIMADATLAGNGGQVAVVGTGTNQFNGAAEARGKGPHGEAGIVSISGLSSSILQAGLVAGTNVTTGVTMTASAASAKAGFEFVDPDPGADNAFGRPSTGLFNLSTNNTLITSPGDSFGGAGAGAAYLFSDRNGALLSTLRGSHAGDAVGSTVSTFLGGGFAVVTPGWNGNIGAVTFGNGTTGFTGGGGAVSSLNSLIGSAAGDRIGSGGLTLLFNGDCLVLSPGWNGNAGAVTWVDPLAGVTGVVGAGNSLVGAAPGDAIGSGGISELSNGANYLVLSPSWGGGRGAITNGDEFSAILGTVSASNSLVGAAATDGVGSGGSVVDSGLGYYLVTTSNWGGGAGAVTWNSSLSGTVGVVSSTNSLVGTAAGDNVGSGGITILLNDHNFVVSSPDWNNQTGAVTWGDGSHLITGVVGSANSLVGAASGDRAGSGGLTVLLDNASYVVNSPDWSSQAGAVTWASDASGVHGVISASNSLVGAGAGDRIGSGGVTVLDDGNFLVLSPAFGGGAGAVTWENVFTGRSGVVGSGNSLVGSSSTDAIGSGGIFQLSDASNYLVLSPSWNGGRGAVTEGSVSSSISGVVGSGNSLVGASTGDHVGTNGSIIDPFVGYYLVTTPNWGGGAGAVTWSLDGSGTTGVISASNSLVGGGTGDHLGSGGTTILFNNDFVVDSPDWNNQTGAVTWGSALSGVTGLVSSANSLVGATGGDEVGSGGVVRLTNGINYLVLSPLWGGGKGAVTNGINFGGVAGTVSASNSLVGAATGDGVGASGSITDQFTGYYLVTTSNWGGGAGAVTWNDDRNGTTGVVSASNSLVGSNPGALADQLGSGGITILNDGNYVVDSPNWNFGAGAVTWGNATGGVSGQVSASNSLVGVSAPVRGGPSGSNAAGDLIGNGGIIILGNGNYLVLSPHFDIGMGAVTWVDASVGLAGQVGASNSLVGSLGSDNVGSGGITLLSSGNYLVSSPQWNHQAGAVTWGSASSGVAGIVSGGNSLVGSSSNDSIGSGGIFELSNGSNYLVLSPLWGGGMGAITNGSETSGVAGVVSSSNSLVGAAIGDRVGTTGSIIDPFTGYYLVETSDWGDGAGAVTWNSDSSGTTGVVGAANSLVGSLGVHSLGGLTIGSDQLGSGGIYFLADGNYLVDSPQWNNQAGAVTWGRAAGGVSGVVSAANSLVGRSNVTTDSVGLSVNVVGAPAGDEIGSGGIATLDNGNYLVDSPNFEGGAGAVTFGKESTGRTGTVGASNSLVGANSSDQIGSGGVIFLPNGDYLIESPQFAGGAGAVTWGSETSGVAGLVSASNSLTGGGPDSGEQFAGLSADGNIYLVAFTTDTSAGGDGRVLGGSVNGPSSSSSLTPTSLPNFFDDPAVIAFEVSGFNLLFTNSQFYISDPNAPTLEPVSLDVLAGGAVNEGHGNNLAGGSSTSGAPGPRRLVTPGNGVWNIFSGFVHSAPPPAFVSRQLQLNLSPEVLAHLNEILFGHP